MQAGRQTAALSLPSPAMAPSSREVTLAYSLGFRMTALPAASAGATFHTCASVCARPAYHRFRETLVMCSVCRHEAASHDTWQAKVLTAMSMG